MKKQNIIFLLGVCLAIILSYIYFSRVKNTYTQINSFDDCIHAGYPLYSLYPEECRMPGKVFSNPRHKKEKEAILMIPKEVVDFKNISYIIEGQSMLLTNGVGTLPPNALLKRSTTSIEITGTPLSFDINNDGILDTTFLLKSTIPSSNRDNYYIASSLSLNTGYVGTNALYVTDSISTSNFVYKNEEISLVYSHNPTTTPITKYFVLKSGILEEVKSH